MGKANFSDWPDSWPPLTAFVGPLDAQVASLQHTSSDMEQHVIIRFKNRYGVKISQNFLHDKLYSVTVLRFFGSHLENYHLVKGSHLSRITWYLTTFEVLSICEQVANLYNRSASS
jgi:hypothetical protein